MKRYYILSLLLALLVNAGAQSPGYTLHTLGTRDGLMSPKIYSLLQDHFGYLWIGSEIGISRYNGYEFENYQYSNTNQQIGKILCIAEDSNRVVWMGGDKGLFYFKKEQWHQVQISGRQNIAVEAMVADKEGNLWLGEINDLYEVKKDTLRQLTETKNINATLHIKPFLAYAFRMHCLAVDNANNLYGGSFNGLYIIDKKTRDKKTIWQNPEPDNEVVSIAAINADTLLFNCSLGPIRSIINGHITDLKKETLLGERMFKKGDDIYALSATSIEAYRSSSLHQFIYYGNETNNATAALLDKENNFWIGSWEGLLKYTRSAFTIYTIPAQRHQDIFSMLETEKGELLFGGNLGTVYYKKNEHLLPYPLLKPFARSEIMSMYQHSDGSYWMGSGYQGISRIKNGRLTNWNEANVLPDNHCEEFYNAGGGKLLASTEHGVLTIYPDSTDPIDANYTFQQKYSRNPKLMGCFKANNAYYFYSNQGLFKLQNNALLQDSIIGMPVVSLTINKAATDNDGFIWLATQGNGLLRCKAENGRLILLQQFLKANGLLSDIILSVLVDKNNNIWLADYMSISLLENKAPRFWIRNFTTNDGLLSTYYHHLKLEQQKNGKIWGLSSMGIFSFHPDSVYTNTLAPTVWLHTISFNGIAQEVHANNPQPDSYSYKNNSPQFSFIAISLTDPSKIRYAYRLVGSDTNWTETFDRAVLYNSLPAGSYRFELKACNNSNIWTSTPTVYNFIIKAPFWQTWWFISILSLLTAILIWVFVKRRINTIKKQAAIQQHMAELEARALRAQMNPHFIFNSLNAIQECIITQKFDAAYEYLSKFSRLLRLVLNHSEKEFISLSSELEMIELYLSLESLRFKQSFNYSIHVGDDIETDLVKVPSMIIQPFVENAVWHGLRHKEGAKNLSITVHEAKNNLIIKIEDDGVGRKKAGAIKSQKIGAGQFDSKGTVLSQQRINMLNKQYKQLSHIHVYDLVDENAQACGTKVVISISLQ